VSSVGAGTRVRPLAAPDLGAVLELERETFPNPWRREHFLPLLESDVSVARVAEGPGGVVGYAIGWAIADEAELANLAVAEPARRGGLGGRLLESFLDEAARRGARRVFLEVREGNRSARAFYERRGFTVVGRRTGYYSSPREDAITMVRELAPPGGPSSDPSPAAPLPGTAPAAPRGDPAGRAGDAPLVHLRRRRQPVTRRVGRGRP
jgi:ribosomal-protein-alanine N-acetyltransferase